MEKISTAIVNHRKLISIVFLVLAVFSIFSTDWVKVEEDITEYLPDTAAAKQGLTVMNQELETYASGTALVRDISKSDAKALGEKIADLDGVLQLSFDADSEGSWKDNNAKYSVTFSGPATDQSAIDGMEHLKEALADYNASVVSDSFSNYSDELTEQMAGVLGLVAILVVIVLLLTSTTYAEVPVFLITFIAAALINMGTNFFMGTISFVSNSVAIVLQLALSVDYAIIFCNRYKEEHETRDIQEAVQVALAQSIPAITASSLTTIAGLAAMSFMEFKLGLDMSIALIKAIIISLLTVFLLMPFLLCVFGKLMDRTKHKSFIPKVDFLGKFAYMTRFIIPPIFVVLAVFACVSFNNVQYDYDGELVNIFNETEERATTREMTNIFGNDYTVALLVPSGDYEKEAALAKELESTPGITEVTSIATIDAGDGYHLGDSVGVTQFMSIASMDETTTKGLFAYYAAKNGQVSNINFTTYKAPLVELLICAHELTENGQVDMTQSEKDQINEIYDEVNQALDQLQGENYSCIAVKNNYAVQGTDTYNFLDSLLVMARAEYETDDVYITGDQVSAQGFASTFNSDMQLVSILSIIFVMLILLFTFRSIAMPILLIIVIQGSIWINFAFACWTHSYVFFMCYLIVSSIQMGANIDYAIVISTRYNEMRKADMAPRDSIIKTLNLAFPTVLTSGTMMIFSGAMIALRISDEVIAGMGQFVATGTVITLILVNFALPQILLLGDRIVQATTINVHLSPTAKRIGRAASAVVLAAAIVFAAIVPFAMAGRIDSATDEALATAESMKDLATELGELAATVDETDASSVQYQYAEQLLTDQIGSEQLSEGQTEYDEGKADIDSANEELSSGESEYQAGLAEYEAGQQQLAQGKAEYYAGQAQLAAAQEEYAAGQQQLAEAQAEYDEAADELDSIAPIYELAYPIYEDLLSLEVQYMEALASGDTETAESLLEEIEFDQAILEADLGGYTIEEIVTGYESGQIALAQAAAEIQAGQEQLDAAAVEIADGEAQLAQAQAEIASGQAQLDSAAAQLSSARSELDSGYDQVADGQTQLDDAWTQLEDGKKTLAENKEKLNSSIEEINSLADDKEKLRLGTEILQEFPGVSQKVQLHASYGEICAAAEQYFGDLIDNQQQEAFRARAALVGLFLMALLCIASPILLLRHHRRSTRWPAFVSGIGALAFAVLWSTTDSYGILPLVAGIVLAVAALLFALVNSHAEKTRSLYAEAYGDVRGNFREAAARKAAASKLTEGASDGATAGEPAPIEDGTESAVIGLDGDQSDSQSNDQPGTTADDEQSGVAAAGNPTTSETPAEKEPDAPIVESPSGIPGGVSTSLPADILAKLK